MLRQTLYSIGSEDIQLDYTNYNITREATYNFAVIASSPDGRS